VAYIEIFGLMIFVALVLVFTRHSAKNRRAAELLPPEARANFLRTVNSPKVYLLLVWAALVFGGIAGAAVSGVYWLLR